MKTPLLSFLASVALSALSSAQTPSTNLRHQIPPNLLGECDVFANADNHYRLQVNGEKILDAASFNTTQSKKVTLYRGDVITIYGKNFEAGTRGGVCVTILKDGKPILTTKDFKYAVKPKKPDWQTSSSLDEFKEPDFYIGTYSPVANEKNPTMAWGKGSDRHSLELYFKALLR